MLFGKKDASAGSAVEKPAKKRKTLNKKYLKNGSYSMIASAVFIAIVIVLNLIISQLPSKYTQVDMTDSNLYSIGDTTREELKKLNYKVKIYQIYQDGYEDDNISLLLGKYEEESSKISVEAVDPVVSPNFVSQYTSDSLSENSLIVVALDENGEEVRSKVINYDDMYDYDFDYSTYSYTTTAFDGEGQITGAINYVNSEELPVIYVLTGHGEESLDSTIEEDIQKANMEVKSLNLISSGGIPEDASMIMLLAPSSDISSDEKEQLVSYLEDGGKMMIFSNYSSENMENFDALLNEYGVNRVDGIVMDTDADHYAMGYPDYLLPTVNSTSASSASSSSGYYVLLPDAQGIEILEDASDSISVESILTTSDSSYAKTAAQISTYEKEDGDIDGPFAVGVAITKTLETEEEAEAETGEALSSGEDTEDTDDTASAEEDTDSADAEETETKEAQIVYYSSSYILNSQVNSMVSGGNEQLVMESINWMAASSDSTVSQAIPSKSMEVSYLTMSSASASFWKGITMVLLPVLFLVTGIVIWLRRRKA